MNTVVFLPGLGADERLFANIRPGPCNQKFIRWHSPAENDSLEQYVRQIVQELEGSDPPILVGVSLGGIIAMELREIMPVRKTILISSVKSSLELPAYFNMVKTLRMNEWLSPSLLKQGTAWLRPYICGQGAASFDLFKAMLKDADEAFIRWSIRQVLHWNRTAFTPGGLVHIHGTDDLVFPYHNISQCDYSIRGGAHDMILSKPDEISDILARELQ